MNLYVEREVLLQKGFRLSASLKEYNICINEKPILTLQTTT